MNDKHKTRAHLPHFWQCSKYLLLLLLMWGLYPVAQAKTHTSDSQNPPAPPKLAPALHAEKHSTDPQKPLLVHINHPDFSIRLKSNLTTGYRWYLKAYNAKLVDPIGHNVRLTPTKQVGVPQISSWRFQLKPEAFVVPQVTYITLVYRRFWEQKPAKVASFVILSDPEPRNA